MQRIPYRFPAAVLFLTTTANANAAATTTINTLSFPVLGAFGLSG